MKCGMKKGGKADARKGMLKNKDKMSTKLNKMSLGPAASAGAMPSYYKGGKVDGCIKKGHTKGKMK